jgi:hypothetical protein
MKLIVAGDLLFRRGSRLWLPGVKRARSDPGPLEHSHTHPGREGCPKLLTALQILRADDLLGQDSVRRLSVSAHDQLDQPWL